MCNQKRRVLKPHRQTGWHESPELRWMLHYSQTRKLLWHLYQAFSCALTDHLQTLISITEIWQSWFHASKLYLQTQYKPTAFLVISCPSEDRLLTRLSLIDQSSRYATDSMKCLTFVTTDCNNATVSHNAFADHSRLQDTQACPSQKTFLLKQHDFKIFQCRSMAWSLSLLATHSNSPIKKQTTGWLTDAAENSVANQDPPPDPDFPLLYSSLSAVLCSSISHHYTFHKIPGFSP